MYKLYKYKTIIHFVQVQYTARIMETPTEIYRRSLPSEPPVVFFNYVFVEWKINISVI